MSNSILFHLAIPINDIDRAKAFYGEGLGCQLGRENVRALIFNFYGHQVVAHMTGENLTPPAAIYPRHFGLIFPSLSDWQSLLNRCQQKNLPFYQQPKVRFKGQLTEHHTFFLQDPFFNLLEFKYYRFEDAIFGGKGLPAIGDR